MIDLDALERHFQHIASTGGNIRTMLEVIRLARLGQDAEMLWQCVTCRWSGPVECQCRCTIGNGANGPNWHCPNWQARDEQKGR